MIDTVTKHKSLSTGEVNSYKVTYVGSNTITYVPFDPDNTDYEEIMRQVKEGKLTIKDAD
jgi:hypothetical protein|tara:strand:+ start:365 stop:544 length:180 start_codon:yes stop_codon:yes gene_type:complete